jgi:DnaA family protein
VSAQLPLTLRWPAQQSFDMFVPGDSGSALAAVRAAAQGDTPWVFLAGPPGSGKSHLLLAACAFASAHRRSAQYLSLAKKGSDSIFRETVKKPESVGQKMESDPFFTIRDLGGSDLLALDDVHAIAGQRDAEHALFDLYNRCKMEKSTLLFAAVAPPAQLGLGLPDLLSRLAGCTQALLKPLDDTARRHAVRQRAQARGLDLDDNVLDWLFAHTARDLGSLSALLERIDRAALAAQRRVTVPFLRRLLSDENANG